MKVYLEVEQILSEEQLITTQPQIIRIEVKDKNEAISKYNSLKSSGILDGFGKYVARVHYCFHDEDPKKPCKVDIIEKT